VAYQFAMVVFLAPYGIVAQPIHTAVLPQLAAEAQRHDRAGLRTSVRWAADAMVVATMPVAALLTALSAPVMAVLAFGQAGEAGGPELLGASLVGLALGVPAYGGFLLLTRVSYALGNSRAPAVASVVVAVLGAAGMLGAAAATEGSDTMVLIGIAHTLAYTLGAIALAARLRGVVGWAWHPGQLVPTLVAIGAGGLAWLAMEVWSPEGRVTTIIATAVLGALGMTAYAGALRLLRALPPSGPVAAEAMPQ
jgi:putative peptidoglycan lipid II flippase